MHEKSPHIVWYKQWFKNNKHQRIKARHVVKKIKINKKACPNYIDTNNKTKSLDIAKSFLMNNSIN